MLESKASNTPIVITESLSSYEGDAYCNPACYRSVLGAFQYITTTRPNLSFSVNKLC